MCRTKQFKQKITVVQKVNAIEKADNSNFVYIREMQRVNQLDMKASDSAWLQNFTMNENEVVFKLDSGSQVTAIPKSELLKLYEKPIVRKSNSDVLHYGGNIISILGELSQVSNLKVPGDSEVSRHLKN